MTRTSDLCSLNQRQLLSCVKQNCLNLSQMEILLALVITETPTVPGGPRRETNYRSVYPVLVDTAFVVNLHN